MCEAISFHNIKLTEGFWKSRQNINKEVTIYNVKKRFEETGRFKAFEFKWKPGDKDQPDIFWDSDVAKWIEAAAYIYHETKDSGLEKEIDKLVDLIEKNQDKNGYFNIYYTVVKPSERWKHRMDHELYCAGHLFEAAVAYYNASKKDKFLKVMCKYADHIERVFVIDKTSAFKTCGHPEIELALVRLYKVTKEKRYLELSKFFIDNRGMSDADSCDYGFANSKYDQSHLPVREQYTAEGHAVRAAYLYSAMADLALIYNDKELKESCKKIFDNISQKKMYITGGIGSSSNGEAFTIDYDLPNMTAYAETCAAISLIFFAQRMLKLDRDSKYADILERALYNGVLSGISLDGKAFFYENPLEIDPKLHERDSSVLIGKTRFPSMERKEVFDCSCCPPNISRFIASIGNIIFEQEDNTIFINQYISCECDLLGIKMITGYPNDGFVRIEVQNISRLALRIPYWCEKFDVSTEYKIEKGYAYIEDASNIEIKFEIKPQLIECSPLVNENAKKVAVQIGPIVYCLESVDNGSNLSALSIRPDFKYKLIYSEFFNCNLIEADGFRKKFDGDWLYRKYKDDYSAQVLKFIPYYGFANRGISEMSVWINI